jgi:hypothetical protein
MKIRRIKDWVEDDQKDATSNLPYQQILFPYDPIEYWQRMRELIKSEVAIKASSTHPLGSVETNGLTYKPVFKIDEVCALFSVTRQTIHDWVKHGLLKPRKVRSRVYFLAEDVQNLLAEKADKI